MGIRYYRGKMTSSNPVPHSHVYSYYLPGVTFVVHVGKGIKQEQSELCCYSNQGIRGNGRALD
jgi:hypothetical protein